MGSSELHLGLAGALGLTESVLAFDLGDLALTAWDWGCCANTAGATNNEMPDKRSARIWIVLHDVPPELETAPGLHGESPFAEILFPPQKPRRQGNSGLFGAGRPRPERAIRASPPGGRRTRVETAHRLVQQHPEPIGGAQPAGAGGRQQRGLQRGIDQVGDHRMPGSRSDRCRAAAGRSCRARWCSREGPAPASRPRAPPAGCTRAPKRRAAPARDRACG